MKANKLALLLMLGLVGLASCGGGTSSGSANGSPDTPTSSGGASTSEVPTSSGGGISEDSTSSGGGTSPAEVVRVAIAGASTVTAGERITLTATVTGSLNTNVTWSGGQSGVATINSSGEVVAAADVSVATPVTFRATSVADTSAYAEHVVTVNPAPVPEEAFNAEIIITDFTNEANTHDSVVEASGAYMMKVEVSDLPNGKSVSDCTFEWPNDTAIVHYGVNAGKGENSEYREFVVNFAGIEDIEVSVTCEGEKVVAKRSFEVTKNAALYTEISTAAEFVSTFIEGETNITGRYILTKNIDLGGYVTDTETTRVLFNGVLDGDGYTVSNFETSPSARDNTGGGLFYNIARGIIRNTHFIGKVNATGGWAGLLCREIQTQSIIENCVFEAENISTIGGDWTWQRNGAITGCLKGTLRNIVTLSTANTGTATIDDQMLAITPYAYDNANDHPKMINVYTNKSKDLSVPFDASGTRENGMVPNTFFDGCYTVGIDFSNVEASVFSELPADIWTIAANSVPALAHDGEAPDVLAPQVTVNGTSKSIRADATYQIVADTKFFSATPTITYTSSNTDAATVDQNGLVTGVAEGEATITVRATAGVEEATATVVITVTSAEEPVPDVSARYTVTEIYSADNGAWLRYQITAAEGNVIPTNAVQFTSCTLTVASTQMAINGTNEVGGTTFANQVLTVGIGYQNAAFHVEETVTSVIILSIDDVVYSITTVFTSQNNSSAVTYAITSSVCAIVE